MRTSSSPTNTSRQVIDLDDKSIIGTQEGIAYITAKYQAAYNQETYTSSSMRIIVTDKKVEEDTDKDGKTYMVTASSLRVRSGAGTNFSQIGSLKNGATVKVESIANGWAKLENGGYVSAQYLAEVVDNGEAQTCTSPPAPSTSARAPAPPTRRSVPSPAAPLCRWSASPATGRS